MRDRIDNAVNAFHVTKETIGRVVRSKAVAAIQASAVAIKQSAQSCAVHRLGPAIAHLVVAVDDQISSHIFFSSSFRRASPNFREIVHRGIYETDPNGMVDRAALLTVRADL